ncbi:hypothetical protein DL546_005081 [Coniochaeta pulveracea]|uniref:RRM domain-containing protein n=1 Tax=Coniochaeta pulveracea TaxID=177199 RepID=A0A420Y6Q8_9PEZI|nr:hypothetical protein DL546_005081 [Coniochaeta pulveracea]
MAAKQGKQGANDFQAAIDQAREKKKHEALAAKIFGRSTNSPSTTPNRRSSAPAAGGSLASRVGVKKNRAPPSGPRAAQPKAKLEAPSRSNTSSPRPNSLANRITDPSRPQPSPPAGPKPRGQQRRAAQVAQALIRTELQQNNHHHHAPPPVHNTQNAGFNKGISIRGLAGPFVVMAQNFAPGTTAADIESAMTPIGGLVMSCRLLKTSPIVIAEIVFESKEGADAVIARFNNQTADGRLLHVYHKVGAPSAPLPASRSAPAPQPPSAPRAQRDRDDMVIDGSMGFDDPQDPSYVIDTQGTRGADSYRPSGGLYSDRIVPGRSGRNQGGGGRNRRR